MENRTRGGIKRTFWKNGMPFLRICGINGELCLETVGALGNADFTYSWAAGDSVLLINQYGGRIGSCDTDAGKSL